MCNNLAQLKSLYPDCWEILLANFDSFLYLGGYDIDTFNLINKFSGKSVSKTNPLELTPNITYDEIYRMERDKCILMIRGLETFNDFKYKLDKHKNYKLIDT